MTLDSTNEVVVDIDMLAVLFAGFYEYSDLFHALQFASLAEQLVLRDRLVVTTIEDDFPPTNDEIEGRKLVKDLLTAWHAADAVSYQTITSAAVKELKDQDPLAIRASTLSPAKPGNTIEATDDVFGAIVLQASDALHAERIATRAASLLPLQQVFYEMSANVRADHSVCDLTGRYSSLAAAIMAMRQEVRIDPAAYMAIPLPPIAYDVFKNTRSLDGVYASALEARERFADLRSRLGQLQQLLDDPTVSLKDKVRHRARWMAAWESLGQKYDPKTKMGIASTTHAIYKVAPDIPGVIGLNPSSWISLLTNIAESMPELWGHWRLRALHRTFEHYARSPDADLGRAVSNLIGHQIPDDETRDLRDTLDLMNQLKEAAVLTLIKSD